MTNESTEAQADFARRVGKSRQWIHALVKRGLPSDASGQVRIAAALQWLSENVPPQHGAEGGERSGESEGLMAARIRLTSAQAAKAELDLKTQRDRMLDRGDARRIAVAFARLYRDALLNFPARQGPELAAAWGVDPRVVVGDLESALRTMLTELAHEPMPFE